MEFNMDLSSGSTGLIIVYLIVGFITFIFLASGITMAILWRRRKLTFTNFLSDTGQWERRAWKPEKLSDTFAYQNCSYKFDIKKCTRDKLNRPIAHYYKGNPEQQIFDFAKGNTKVQIGTAEITGKDFMVLMTSKVLRDIFQDDEVMNMLMIILIAVILIGIAGIIVTATHNPQVVLKDSNQTIDLIARGVKQAITLKT
jgi:hypothetical protein